MLLFFLHLILCSVKGTKLVNRTDIGAILRQHQNVVAFYNIFAEGPDFHGIVTNQVNTMKHSGLLERLDKVFYATIGSGGATYDIPDSKFTHLSHREHGEEMHTLHMLYEFCHANPKAKVLYFHDKGSFHHTYFNAKFCSVLNCFVLNPHCIDALDTHDTCGWRISPIPRIHYSGNFWWARCQYVKSLIDPMSPVNNQTFLEVNKQFTSCLTTESRYFSEAWIGTGPNIHPADCMNASVDTSYLFGYNMPAVTDQYCPGAGDPRPPGLPCQTAGTLVNVKAFKPIINHMNSLNSNPVCRDNRKLITAMTELWYGEPPHTYLDWMAQLYEALPLPEGAVVRFTDSTQVYIMQNQHLRGIPNLKTFIHMGLDFDDVKVIFANERESYKFGDMLPSN